MLIYFAPERDVGWLINMMILLLARAAVLEPDLLLCLNLMSILQVACSLSRTSTMECEMKGLLRFELLWMSYSFARYFSLVCYGIEASFPCHGLFLGV